MNKADKQYALNLEHILQSFSTIFCPENSGMSEEESLKKEEKEELKKNYASVVELVDTRDLKSLAS